MKMEENDATDKNTTIAKTTTDIKSNYRFIFVIRRNNNISYYKNTKI